ncbi:MAG: S24/S26 family peptidase [Sneathiellales bacterium]|nr:S24/S26 family peptidase [Sneathiellales bacterium]
MAPTLSHGDYVLARLTSKSKAASLTTNRVVLFTHLQFGFLVKRLTCTDKEGVFVVTGDNPVSTPSETLGEIRAEQIKAVVRWRISPQGIQKM